MERYHDRYAAGILLATFLKSYANHKETLILALPRGGVPVAYEIAKNLSLPLDVFIVRKLGVPGHEELAMGAIAMNDTVVFNNDIIASLKITKQVIDDVIFLEKKELERRNIAYRGHQPFPIIKNKTIILVDDGIATGASVRAAITALRQLQPKAIVLTVPISEVNTCKKIGCLVDTIICPMQLKEFLAVGQGFENFNQTSDEEVHALLKQSHEFN